MYGMIIEKSGNINVQFQIASEEIVVFLKYDYCSYSGVRSLFFDMGTFDTIEIVFLLADWRVDPYFRIYLINNTMFSKIASFSEA